MSDDTFALVERKHKEHTKKTTWDKPDKFERKMKQHIKKQKNKVKWDMDDYEDDE
jgi:hypothetical protein